jgi:hypothetical protein
MRSNIFYGYVFVAASFVVGCQSKNPNDATSTASKTDTIIPQQVAAPCPPAENWDELHTVELYKSDKNKELIRLLSQSIRSSKWAKYIQKKDVDSNFLADLETNYAAVLATIEEAGDAKKFSEKMSLLLDTSAVFINKVGYPYIQEKEKIIAILDKHKELAAIVNNKLLASNDTNFWKIYAKNLAGDFYVDFLMFLLQQDKLEIKYDKFDIFAKSKQLNFNVGETNTIEFALASIAAYSSPSIVVEVEGQKIISKNGYYPYIFTPKTVGRKILKAKIATTNPATGETHTVNTDFQYQVNPKIDTLR